MVRDRGTIRALSLGINHADVAARFLREAATTPDCILLAGRYNLLGQYDVPLPAAALQFPLAHPAVPAVLAGPRSPEEIAEVAGYLDHEIPPAFWQALEADGLVALGSC